MRSAAVWAGLWITAITCSAARAGWPDVRGSEIWSEYVRKPNTHPHLFNWSYAGYRHGEREIPEHPVLAIATDGGASTTRNRQVPIAELGDADREYIRRIEWCAKEMAAPAIK